MKQPVPTIRINVDVTNPGQYFACCGLLELADRLWPEAEGWFEDEHTFCLASGDKALFDVLSAARTSVPFIESTEETEESEEDDADEDPIIEPICLDLRYPINLDWWSDKSLKTWAGSMKVEVIALAMSRAIEPSANDPLNQLRIVYTPTRDESQRTKKAKKREPFYFDSRRGPNAHSRDVGFSVDKVKNMKSVAAPAVEFLALLALQRARPTPTGVPRQFVYWTWNIPVSVQILPAIVNGLVPCARMQAFRFENGFRSGQKKHKSFLSAILLNERVSDEQHKAI